MPKKLTKPFIIILIVLVLIGCYFVFKPFLMEILVAAILASIFYKPYEKLVKLFGNRRQLAALAMCLFLVIVLIVPTVNLLVYAAGKSVVAYSQTADFFSQHSLNQVLETRVFNSSLAQQFNLFGLGGDGAFKTTVLNVLRQSSEWLISGATFAAKETANFIISLVLIIFTMFFFFVDGKKILLRFSDLSPLPQKYDQELFSKFRAVSYTTFVSTFVTAAAQGVVGAIGFAIVGFPAFLAGVVVALLSLLPYLGSMLFYVPVGLYYLAVGKIWQGIFVLLWGLLIIGTIDNFIRTYMVKGKVAVNPIFAFFSILGGIALFGFWGMILGPLIVALAVTVFHIYEIEFSESLERRSNEETISKEEKKDIVEEIKKVLS